MTIIKKYTAIQVDTQNVNDTVKVDLYYGDVQGPYYNPTRPEQEFDTEEEAISYAFEYNKYSTWLIVPVVRFRLS